MTPMANRYQKEAPMFPPLASVIAPIRTGAQNPPIWAAQFVVPLALPTISGGNFL